MVFPIQKQKNNTPDIVWLIANSSSISGIKGEVIDFAEKLIYQSDQNNNNRDNFINQPPFESLPIKVKESTFFYESII